MPDDVLLSKAESIERCLARVNEEYSGHGSDWKTNFSRQDAIVLNILRACEGCIGIAMHLVKKNHLGLPKDTRDAFKLLWQAGIIEQKHFEKMQAMVGFRNVAVHDYQNLNLDVVEAIIHAGLDDIRHFKESCLKSS